MPQITVVIPALNEAESIASLVRSMPWHLIQECIVVDNGSTDATAANAQQAGARVVPEPRRGYGQACMTGVASIHPGTEIIVLMDGDGSDVPAELPNLINPILAGQYDFVIGSRIRGHREQGSMTPAQIFASRLFAVLLRLLYRTRYTDMGPYRAITPTALHRLQMTERTYGWNLEMQMRAAQQNLRILEIPTTCRRRTAGTSKVSGNLTASLKAATRILAVLLRVALNHKTTSS